MAEFLRLKGSGRPEDAIRTPQMRLQLVASIEARLKGKRKTPAKLRDPNVIDHKRRQANDLD
ncbi:hypothetical protein [Cupriavidus respiraculi]|nr:hypothetical protein [Cupriavidus respiraculi]